MFSLQRQLMEGNFGNNASITNPIIGSNHEKNFAQSYTAWKCHTFNAGYQSSEILTDFVVRPALIEEFRFLTRIPSISPEEVNKGIINLAPWTYYFNIHNHTTESNGTFNGATIIYHRYRNDLIINSLLRLFDTNMSDLTAIDVGCNCGFFSLELDHLGVSSVTGVDLREENIKQAEFIRKAMGLTNTSFLTQNLKDFSTIRKFDLVLNLGLMYHLSTPFEVMKSCYQMTNKVCVIDTVTHKEPFSGYYSLSNKNINSPIEGDLSYELQPTYRGILDVIYASGFKHIIEIMTVADVMVEQYSDLSRRCFFAFKDEELYLSALDKLG